MANLTFRGACCGGYDAREVKDAKMIRMCSLCLCVSVAKGPSQDKSNVSFQTTRISGTEIRQLKMC